MGTTKELATYVVSSDAGTIPPDVRHEAHRALLNYVGCAVGGCREPAVDIALRTLLPYSGKPIEWDAKNIKVTNDEAANKLVRREYREGYSI